MDFNLITIDAYDQLVERAQRAEQRIRELSSRDKQPEE